MCAGIYGGISVRENTMTLAGSILKCGMHRHGIIMNQEKDVSVDDWDVLFDWRI